MTISREEPRKLQTQSEPDPFAYGIRTELREVVAEIELTSLHQGNFTQHQVRPSKSAEWDWIWKSL